jgi:positive regulator of sigma E activity
MGEPEQHNRKELVHRIGTFFILLAVGFFVFFLLSDSAGAPALNFFCWALILATVGFIFRAQFKRPTASSGRFGWLRKLLRGKDE